MASPAPLRPLSVLERSCWHVNQAACHNLVTVAEVDGAFSPEDLRRALDGLQASAPLLRARIGRAGGRLAFCAGGAPPVRLEVLDVPEEARWAHAERALNTRLPTGTGPLARCRLLRHGGGRSTVLLTVLHAAADGRCSFFLVRDLVRGMGRGSLPGPGGGDGRGSYSLHAALPREAKGIRGWLRLAGMTGREAAGHLRERGRPRPLALDARPPPFLRWTRIHPVRLTGEETARLLRRARREGAGVHSALCAAGLLAVHRVMTDGRPRVLACTSAVDMRGRVAPAVGERMGLFVSALWVGQRVGPRQPFWDLARQVREKFADRVRRGDPALVAGRGGLTLPLLERIPGRDRSGRIVRAAERMMHNFEGTGVSSVGNLEMPGAGEGPVSLRSVSFAGTLASLGYFLAVANTFDGRLHVNYLANDPMIRGPRAQALVEEAVGALRRAVE